MNIPRQVDIQPKGPQAARLRQRAFVRRRRFQLPAELLPGSLSPTARRCGKPTCHCATGAGPPIWDLTCMVAGTKRVERIPDAWVEAVRHRGEAGREFKQALAERPRFLTVLRSYRSKENVRIPECGESCAVVQFRH